MAVAQRGIDELRQYTDSLILIPNEKLSLVLGKKVTLLNCFKAANDVLQNAVRSEEHTSDLQSLMRISYAVFCLKNKNRALSKRLRSEENHSAPQNTE